MDTPNLVVRRVENIIKSQEDKRLYRGLELANHMKVLLVSDPTTDKSAAALDVNVGNDVALSVSRCFMGFCRVHE